MISTDGVGVSILFLRKDLVGKRIPAMKNKENAELYVDELKDTTAYQSKKIVGIDPNKGDLIYCVDGCSKDSTTFRYSQDQRRKETKSKKYRNLLLRMKHHTIQGKNIYAYETELSQFNRKTLHIEKYKEYLTAKNHCNHVVGAFYQRELFRKLKFSSYINTKRNEQKMMNNFRKTFGEPDEVVICIGDWEQRKQMKYKEPTIGVGMRTLFRKNNYQVLLVDEFRTSCRCSKCEGGICEKFLPRRKIYGWYMVYFAVRADVEHGIETVIVLPISTKYLITPYITWQDQVIYVENNVSCHFTELVRAPYGGSTLNGYAVLR